MKKFLTLAVAAAVLSATVSALTFKVDGYARAGLTSTLNTKNKDGDKEAKTVSTKQWLAGDYFGGGSRLRLNGDILSDDGTAGVKFRFQYTGSFEDFDITKDEVKYVYAWGKGFDGKVIAGAGKIGDKYISSDGWEGFSLIDGKTGVFAAYTPIEGLTLLAAVVKDYLVEEEIAELDDNGNYKKEKKFDKRAGVYGFKYSAGILTVDAAFSGAGRFYANVNLTPSNLLAALEYAYESEDIPMYPHDVEPWEKNITTLVDFDSKWKSMVKKGTPIPTPLSKKAKEAVSKVGVFEGAGYSVKGVYRGVQDCRMRINETPDFCPVCKQALTDIIDFYTK